MSGVPQNHFLRIEEMVNSVKDEPLQADLCSSEIHQLAQDLSKALTSLESENAKLKEGTKVAKEKLSSLEKERINAKKDLNKLQADDEGVSKQLARCKKELANLQYSNRKYDEKMKLSSKDENLLQKHEKELSTYRKLVGVRWDFTVPSHILSGLVSNHITNKVDTFEFDKNIHSKPHIIENLWGKVKKCTTEDWQVDKENKKP